MKQKRWKRYNPRNYRTDIDINNGDYESLSDLRKIVWNDYRFNAFKVVPVLNQLSKEVIDIEQKVGEFFATYQVDVNNSALRISYKCYLSKLKRFYKVFNIVEEKYNYQMVDSNSLDVVELFTISGRIKSAYFEIVNALNNMSAIEPLLGKTFQLFVSKGFIYVEQIKPIKRYCKMNETLFKIKDDEAIEYRIEKNNMRNGGGEIIDNNLNNLEFRLPKSITKLSHKLREIDLRSEQYNSRSSLILKYFKQSINQYVNECVEALEAIFEEYLLNSYLVLFDFKVGYGKNIDNLEPVPDFIKDYVCYKTQEEFSPELLNKLGIDSVILSLYRNEEVKNTVCRNAKNQLGRMRYHSKNKTYKEYMEEITRHMSLFADFSSITDSSKYFNLNMSDIYNTIERMLSNKIENLEVNSNEEKRKFSSTCNIKTLPEQKIIWSKRTDNRKLIRDIKCIEQSMTELFYVYRMICNTVEAAFKYQQRILEENQIQNIVAQFNKELITLSRKIMECFNLGSDISSLEQEMIVFENRWGKNSFITGVITGKGYISKILDTYRFNLPALMTENNRYFRQCIGFDRDNEEEINYYSVIDDYTECDGLDLIYVRKRSL